MDLSTSQNFTLDYAALFGVGRVIGYLKRGSLMSLGAGGASSALLYFVYTELQNSLAFASSLGLGVSTMLLGSMGYHFQKTMKVFPIGVVALLSLGMTGYLHGILRSKH